MKTNHPSGWSLLFLPYILDGILSSMKQDTQSGYAGLIVIILSVAIMATLFVKVYFTPTVQTPEIASFQPNTASGTPPTTEFERMHANVDAANAVRDQLNIKNQETARMLNETE